MRARLSCKAVIFDLDGLVLDSETTYIHAWRLAVLEMGYTLGDNFYASLSGLAASSVDALFLETCGEGFDSQRFKVLSTEFWRQHVEQYGIPVKPGFITLLNLLETLHLPFCLATNSGREEALACLECAGLSQAFPLILTKDDVFAGKPAADIFILAAAKLGVAIEDSLILEDSVIGIVAAVNAGAPCIYVPSAYPVDNWAAMQALVVLANLGKVSEFMTANLVLST